MEPLVYVDGGTVSVELGGMAVLVAVPIGDTGESVPLEPPVGLGRTVELVFGYGTELDAVDGELGLPVSGGVNAEGTTVPLVKIPDVLETGGPPDSGDVPVAPPKDVAFVTG